MKPTLLPELYADDGVLLCREAIGDPSNPTVILSHGGGQTRHSWGNTAAKLAEQGWYAISYDHRGHGESGWSEDKLYNFEKFSRDMQRVAEACDDRPAVVGASLGGMSAMVSAGEFHPGLFSSITLVDVTPNLNREGVNNIYNFMSSHMESGFESLDEAADVVAAYTGRPRKSDTSGLMKNLREREGRFYWHWDPNFFALQKDRAEAPDRVEKAAKNIDVPMLLIRGRMSDVVTDAQVDEFLQMVPHAEYVDVEHARHMVAGDRNDIFTEAVLEFLGRQRQA